MPRKKRRTKHRCFRTDALDALIGETRTPEEIEGLFREMKRCAAIRSTRARSPRPCTRAARSAGPRERSIDRFAKEFIRH